MEEVDKKLFIWQDCDVKSSTRKSSSVLGSTGVYVKWKTRIQGPRLVENHGWNLRELGDEVVAHST